MNGDVRAMLAGLDMVHAALGVGAAMPTAMARATHRALCGSVPKTDTEKAQECVAAFRPLAEMGPVLESET